MLAVPVPHGGGSGGLLHLILHVVAWHALFRLMRGFLVHYTHIPWLGTLLIVVVVVVVVRLLLRAGGGAGSHATAADRRAIRVPGVAGQLIRP